MQFSFQRVVLALSVVCLRTAPATRLGRGRNASTSLQTPVTFPGYYETHQGRGIWKWNVALEMYQRHFAGFANVVDARVLEIGVQSGGSINMFEAVLPHCHYYGADINKNCMAFQDQRTTIFIGDQASVPAWSHFFTTVTDFVDVAVDDGGHQAHQMLTSIQQLLPHVRPGGFYCTEDIHGQNDDYLSKYLIPAADTIAALQSSVGAQVASVHLYPFMIGVQMVGGSPAPLPAPAKVTASLPELDAELSKHPGGTVALAIPNGGSMLTAASLKSILSHFYELYGGTVRQEPPTCHYSMANSCAMIVTNTPQQNLIKAIHVQPTQVLVEVHAQPPVIAAYRKGTEWIPYNGP